MEELRFTRYHGAAQLKEYMSASLQNKIEGILSCNLSKIT